MTGASDLGGLIGIGSAFMLRGRQNFDDFDDAGMGIWELYEIQNLENKPNIGNYGILLCFWSNGAGNAFRIQLAFPRENSNSPQVRARNDTNQAWSAWRTFSFT